ncbi:MAG: helix-hairpin-helix domain-containing protein [Pseudomonadota bacterium]
MPSPKSRATICFEHAFAIRDLRRIPGVGPRIAQDLYDQGFRQVDQLKGCDPQIIYQRQCELQGGHVDRCWLYVARCAVYFAETPEPDPGLLKWWNWQDSAL